MNKKINLICAVDLNWGVGKNNSIPWKLSEDLQRFRQLTTRDIDFNSDLTTAVVMGRKTFLSINETPLQDRLNCVVTSDKQKQSQYNEIPNVMTSHNINNLLNKLVNDTQISSIWVIGGHQIWRETIQNWGQFINKLYLTRVYLKTECDTFFPKLVQNEWIISGFSSMLTSIKSPQIKFRYIEYTKVNMLFSPELQYINLVREILHYGQMRSTRNSMCKSLAFPHELRFHIPSQGFPLMTIKKVPVRQVFEELMWILRGQTNTKILSEKNINIWNANSTREFLDANNLNHLEEGELGDTYGKLMRNYDDNGYDQLKILLEQIDSNPHSRRLIISLWHPVKQWDCALPPCLRDYQFYIDKNQNLISCKANLRSSDVPVALAWNIATVTLFTTLIGHVKGLMPNNIIISIGDAHIYEPHLTKVNDYFGESNNIQDSLAVFPLININQKSSDKDQTDLEKLLNICWEDIEVIEYNQLIDKNKKKLGKLEMVA